MNLYHLDRDELDYAPFDPQGGRGKMHQLFGNQRDALIAELDRKLMA